MRRTEWRRSSARRIALTGWLWSVFCAVAFAVPPTLHPRPHPYDPDWPDVQLILAHKCVGCHRPNCARTDLSSYEALLNARVAGKPVVVPGRPDDSPLWTWVVWNVHGHGPAELPDQPLMPIDKHEWLTAGQLAQLRRWIENGGFEYKLPDTCNKRPLMETDFPSARVCKQCHPKQYAEWSLSMHAYGQLSPAFEAFTLTLVERTSGTIGTFCTRCHTPIGVGLGESASLRNSNRSRLSLEGVTCVTCHRRTGLYYKNSGRIHIEPGKVYDTCIYGPFESSSQQVGAHASQAVPYIKTASFCGDCHDVTSPAGVRLEEAFSEWQNSPAAKQGIRCHDCHMGPVQGVAIPEDQRPLGRAAEVPGIDPALLPLRRLSDHTFAGPDYSLLPDTEFPCKLDWMYECDYRDPSKLTPHQQQTLEELRRMNRAKLRRANEKRYELLRNSAKICLRHPEIVRCGQKLHVEVDVISTTAGHSVPTGFTAQRQVWVSVLVRDAAGQVVFASGDLDRNQDLRDDHSWAVRAGHAPLDEYLLNFQGRNMILQNKGSERSVVVSVNRDQSPLSILRPAQGLPATLGRAGNFRIGRQSLSPLTTVSKSYPVKLPSQPGPYTVHARLNFRHLEPTLMDSVGAPHLKHQLEVVVIDEKVSTVTAMP